MEQTIQRLIERLDHNKKRLAQQHNRRDQLDQTIRNTEENIIQIEYAIQELNKVSNGERKPRIIPQKNVSDFFTHASELFDYLEHRLHCHLNYRLVCTVIWARYRFRSRMRTPTRCYLSPITILNYFKLEREAIC